MNSSRVDSPIWQATIVIGVPIGIIGVVAAPLAMAFGSHQWVCAGTGLGLTVPAGLVTLLVAEWLGKTSQYGGLLAAFVGTFVRLATGLGGGLLVFLACGQVFRGDPLSYWLWLLAAYLTTLTIEMALLVHKQFQTMKQRKAPTV